MMVPRKPIQILFTALMASLLSSGLIIQFMSTGVPVVEAGRSKTPTPTPTSVPNPPPNVPGSWKVVNSPSSSPNLNDLQSVAVVSANDVWAVGQSLVVHWDGANWSTVASADPGNPPDFHGVAAVASNNVWAVGRRQDTVSPYYLKTLIEHWDGSTWNILPSPNGSTVTELLGVAVVSANDIWAVGDVSAPAPTYVRTLIEHWDGSSWSIIPSPNAANSYQDFLIGVAALSANDVWAVGYYLGSSVRTLVEHWDGASWTIVPSPNVGPYGNGLTSVAGRATNDVWAAGSANNDGNTLVLHWNGVAWSVVPSPSVSDKTNSLNGVSIVAGDDIWAIGTNTSTYYTGEAEPHTSYFTLVEHWNGSAWSIVSSPNPGSPDPYDGTVVNQLNGVAAGSSSDVWAVGTFVGSSGTNQTLIEQYTVP